MNDSEIADLVERRLFSNKYFNYTIYSIHKSKGTIVLTRDACGHNVETTLSKIEDGLIPEKCDECRQTEKDKLIAFKNEMQDELKERGLVVVLFETEDNTDSLYIECTKCGAKYYLNEDFELDNEAWEMYCKNWDCMMDALALEGHWFAEGVSNGNIVIKENTYKPSRYSFVQDYEDWYESLTASDGYYESKCEQCNVINIRPLGRCKCEICFNWGGCVHWDGWCESGLVKVWDEIEDQVTIQCEKCGNRYQVSRNDAKKGAFGCFECFKGSSVNKKSCSVCNAVHTDSTYECSGESKIDKVLSITLEEMNFSVRTYNCLKRAGINVIEQLMEMSYNEVLAIKNLGKKSFEEVINRLAMLGLYLKE